MKIRQLLKISAQTHREGTIINHGQIIVEWSPTVVRNLGKVEVGRSKPNHEPCNQNEAKK